MEIRTEKMAAPVKFVVVVSTEEIVEKKKQAYEKIKDSIVVEGFRKGHVPQKIAEDKIGTEKIYRTLIDDVYLDVATDNNILNAYSFYFYGDLKKDVPLTVEFIADVKPDVVLPALETMRTKVIFENTVISEDDVDNQIKFELKQEDRIEDSTKTILEDYDVAIVDFVGTLVDEHTPFQGGTAKGYQITVNEITNGQKNFIDNFEDQMVGMTIGETRQIKVKFPDTYRDTTKAGKEAIFSVTLKAIKQKINAQLNDDFLKSKGFQVIEEYKERVRKDLLVSKQKKNEDDFKRGLITTIIADSQISPIPQIMIDNECEKEWQAFLRRIGKNEEQAKKENKISKEVFLDNYHQKAIDVIKASLVLEQTAKELGIRPTEEQVFEYVLKLSKILDQDEEKKEKIRLELKTNKRQYEVMEKATRNEYVIENLFVRFK